MNRFGWLPWNLRFRSFDVAEKHLEGRGISDFRDCRCEREYARIKPIDGGDLLLFSAGVRC